MPGADQVEETVNQMLIGGLRLPDIESFIERQTMSEEQKSALWLLAWAEEARRRPEHLTSPAARVDAEV